TGTDERVSHTVGVEFFYVAVPSGDNVTRLAYPMATVRSHISEIHNALFRSTALALLFALALSVFVAQAIASRLRRIVRFAEQVAAGDLSARIAEQGGDEIAQVALALDRTARRLEANFSAVRESRAELEALLNSMNDGVIAVDPDMKVLWANQSIAGMIRQPVRMGMPVTEVVRDPDFLSTLRAALESRQRESTIAASLG